MFEVVREVEKEVILMDQTAFSMEIDSITGIPVKRNDQVLKVIKKLEVQILCTQHNPVCSHASVDMEKYLTIDSFDIPPF